VSWRPLVIALCFVFSHFCLSLVILFKVYSECVAIFKFESYAPGSINVDSVSRRNKPKQSMKIKPDDVHVFRNERLLK
jgi:hypothetical protein